MKNFFTKYCSCNKEITFNICSCLRKHNVLFLDVNLDVDGDCFLTMHKGNYHASFFLEASCVSLDLSPVGDFPYENKEFTFEISYQDFDNFISQEDYLIYFNKMCDKFISNLIFA